LTLYIAESLGLGKTLKRFTGKRIACISIDIKKIPKLVCVRYTIEEWINDCKLAQDKLF
jgi:hypothetical protein